MNGMMGDEYKMQITLESKGSLDTIKDYAFFNSNGDEIEYRWAGSGYMGDITMIEVLLTEEVETITIKTDTYEKFDSIRIPASAEQMKGKPDKEFVAVLFRDYNFDPSTDWQGKREAMSNGFKDGFDDLDETIDARGVSAVANPVSEAWWLSAIYRKEDKNKNCKYLESTKHGDGADHALKNELVTKLGTTPNRTVLNKMVDNREIDYTLIDSDSFLAFRRDFETAVGLEYLHHT